MTEFDGASHSRSFRFLLHRKLARLSVEAKQGRDTGNG